MDTKFKAKDYSNMCVMVYWYWKRQTFKKRGAYLWKCKCRVRNIFYAQGYRIANGEIKSCGCSRKVYRDDNFKKALNKLQEGFVEGTFIPLIKNNKLRSNNTSGYVGVSKKGNKWVARISIFGETINLRLF